MKKTGPLQKAPKSDWKALEIVRGGAGLKPRAGSPETRAAGPVWTPLRPDRIRTLLP